MIWIDTRYESDEFEADLTIWINPGGQLSLSGHASLQDNDATLRLIAENRGSSAQCASDGEVEELLGLTIPLRAERSGERIFALIEPAADVQILGSGHYDVVLSFEGDRLETYVGTLSVDFDARRGQGTGPPGGKITSASSSDHSGPNHTRTVAISSAARRPSDAVQSLFLAAMEDGIAHCSASLTYLTP